MKIIHRYFTSKTPWLEQFLTENQIKFSLQQLASSTALIFTVSDTSPAVISELAAHGITALFCYPEYTTRELYQAPWLEIVKRRQIIDIVPSENSFEYSCTWRDAFGAERALHERQIGPLTIRKEPDISKTAFCCEASGTAYLFTGEKMASLIKEYGLSGIELKDVYYKNGMVSGSIFQVMPVSEIPRESIDTAGHSKFICKSCGREQFSLSQTDILRVQHTALNDGCDMYVTPRMWGEGQAFGRYVVSGRLYKILKDNGLTRSMGFAPVTVY